MLGVRRLLSVSSPLPDPIAGPIAGPIAHAMDAATAALHGVGADARELSLLRVGESVLVRAPHAKIVARVERPGRHALAERQLRAARMMAQRGVPAARLVLPDREPWVHEGGIVTLWELLEVVEGTPSLVQLGRLARQLHDATADASASVPVLEPVPDLTNEPPPCDDDTAFLRDRAHELGLRHDRLHHDDPLGMALVHGDLHVHNVVLTPAGPVLVDLERSGWGARSWDFVVQLVGVRRYGRPESAFLELVAAYGIPDPRRWPGLEVLCEIYELHATVWALRLRHRSAAFEREAQLRLDTLRGRDDLPWTIL